MEKISVIIPVYRVEAYLEKCILSVSAQSYPELEIILVDDGSPDNCGEICDRYALQDARIRVIHQKNRGLSGARNAGLDEASGSYILFVDSDDFIHSDMIRILYENMRETKADISVCGFLPVKDGEEVSFNTQEEQERKVFEGEEVMHCLQYRNLLTVVAWNKLYKRSLFEQLRYPEGKLQEDEFLIHHLLDICGRIVFTDRKLYYYLQRTGSIMGTLNWKSIEDGWQACEERLVFLQDHGYHQMAEWTKLQMLHYICKNYKNLMQIPEAGQLLLNWRKRFADLYKELETGKDLSEAQRKLYKYFVIRPELYYNKKIKMENREQKLQIWKQKCKRILKGLRG